jgi:hypothetical protein
VVPGLDRISASKPGPRGEIVWTHIDASAVQDNGAVWAAEQLSRGLA